MEAICRLKRWRRQSIACSGWKGKRSSLRISEFRCGKKGHGISKRTRKGKMEVTGTDNKKIGKRNVREMKAFNTCLSLGKTNGQNNWHTKVLEPDVNVEERKDLNRESTLDLGTDTEDRKESKDNLTDDLDTEDGDVWLMRALGRRMSEIDSWMRKRHEYMEAIINEEEKITKNGNLENNSYGSRKRRRDAVWEKESQDIGKRKRMC